MAKAVKHVNSHELYNALLLAWTRAGKPDKAFEFVKPDMKEVQMAKVVEVSGAGVPMKFTITSVVPPVEPDVEEVLLPVD